MTVYSLHLPLHLPLQMLPRIGLRALVACALLVVAACRESAAPPAADTTQPFIIIDPTAPSHPTYHLTHGLVGTWDVTTVLDQFSFETGVILGDPECTNTFYCTHHRPANGATLAGALVIGDSVAQGSVPGTPPLSWLEYPVVRGTFTGRFCDTVDYQTLTGCTHLGETTTLDYPSGYFRGYPSGPSPADTSYGGVVRGPNPAGRNISFVIVSIDGTDAFSGRVYWEMTTGRSPPSYSGRFIAHRRRHDERDCMIDVSECQVALFARDACGAAGSGCRPRAR